jgi:hypothetical protein
VSSVAHRRARPSEVRRRWRRCPVGPASEQAQISLHRAGDLHPGRHPPRSGWILRIFPLARPADPDGPRGRQLRQDGWYENDWRPAPHTSGWPGALQRSLLPPLRRFGPC